MTSAAPPKKYSLLPSGLTIAGYTVLRTRGEGLQAMVYEAARPDGAKVALKVIHRHLLGDPQIFGRFHREAAILKRLDGEHVVKFIDFVEEDGLLVIALELVDAVSLADVLDAATAPMEIAKAVEIALQVCAALGVAHAAGVVHRDLKPANVLVEEGLAPDLPPHVRVVDFGLAKVVHGDHMTTGLTEQDMIFGTPEYMAPEQARGDDADARADLYAAGVILYEMVVGQVPFHARTPLATMTAHLTEPPPSPRAVAPERGISPALEAVIDRALAKAPDDRYPTARAFAEALVAARKHDVVVISPRKVEDIDGLSTRDTDLNVLISARTLPDFSEPISQERASRQRESAERTKRSPIGEVLITAKSPENAAKAPDTKAVAKAGAGVAGPPSAARRARERFVWIVVAVIAAAIGVAIGAFVGAR